MKGKNGIDSIRLKKLFKALVDEYTPSGNEGPAIQILASFFQDAGIKPLFQKVEEGRENLILLPETADPILLFLGHVDTVTAPDWDKFEWKEEGNRIEGLGTADMKGGCAALAEAYISLLEEGISDLPFALAFVVGEEENGDGTLKLLEDWQFSLAIVGEPSNLQPCFAHYGYIEAKVLVKGQRVHASVAPLGISPIAEILYFLLAAVEYFKNRDEGIIYNFRDLRSSPSGFAVPDWCEVCIDIHIPPSLAPAPFLYDLEELLESKKKNQPSLNARIDFTTVHEGYDLPHRGHFYEYIEEQYQSLRLPFRPASFQSHSDAALLWHAGIRTVVLGPGLIEEAHRSGEGVEWNQIVTGSLLYRELMKGSSKLLI